MVETRFERLLSGLELSHAGLAVLHHLNDGPRARRELARLCRVTDQTMSHTLDRLDRTGHVTRTLDDRDRRRTMAAITDRASGPWARLVPRSGARSVSSARSTTTTISAASH